MNADNKDHVSPGLFDRTLRSVRRAFGRSNDASLNDSLSPDLGEADVARLRQAIDECLAGRGGEVSSRARAAELGEAYLMLSPLGRERFLELLASEYDTDSAVVDDAIAARAAATDIDARRTAERVLRNAVVPPRVRLLQGFNNLDSGVKFLVDLRADLIAMHRGLGPDHPNRANLAAMDADMLRLLTSWFDIGFLELRRITWDTSATVLEKLIDYEAVHAMQSWDDLKLRLADDRRCFGYFHPSMPDEPLIFVEVALVKGISDNVQGLIDEGRPAGDPEAADTAVFYSISNCQRGLAQVSFGNFLIKRVVTLLQHDLPNLSTYVTLSPIPGLRAWLGAQSHDDLDQYLSHSELESLTALAPERSLEGNHALLAALDNEQWWQSVTISETLRGPLERVCAAYLTSTTKHHSGPDRALNRVAHFHLSNGAGVERVNWLADTSERGLAQSAGMMVNYLYALPNIEGNHEQYTSVGKIGASNAVTRAAKPVRKKKTSKLV